MNVRIDQPCTRPLKGHVVLHSFDPCYSFVRYRAKKRVANSFKVVCLLTFFLSDEIIDLCGNV